MKIKTCLIGLLAGLQSCATMSDSLKLGAGVGGVTGAGATYVAQTTSGQPASLNNVALGAGVGIAVGLVTSYFVYKEVEEDRKAEQASTTDMYFGDLPPNPFVFPKMKTEKGN